VITRDTVDASVEGNIKKSIDMIKYWAILYENLVK